MFCSTCSLAHKGHGNNMDACPRCGQGHRAKGAEYWAQVKAKAEEIESDGCTLALQIYKDCCWEHDIAYEFGTNIWGEKRTREEADDEFFECMVCRSALRWYSPISWWRWAAVRLVGGLRYRGETN